MKKSLLIMLIALISIFSFNDGRAECTCPNDVGIVNCTEYEAPQTNYSVTKALYGEIYGTELSYITSSGVVCSFEILYKIRRCFDSNGGEHWDIKIYKLLFDPTNTYCNSNYGAMLNQAVKLMAKMAPFYFTNPFNLGGGYEVTISICSCWNVQNSELNASSNCSVGCCKTKYWIMNDFSNNYKVTSVEKISPPSNICNQPSGNDCYYLCGANDIPINTYLWDDFHPIMCINENCGLTGWSDKPGTLSIAPWTSQTRPAFSYLFNSMDSKAYYYYKICDNELVLKIDRILLTPFIAANYTNEEILLQAIKWAIGSAGHYRNITTTNVPPTILGYQVKIILPSCWQRTGPENLWLEPCITSICCSANISVVFSYSNYPAQFPVKLIDYNNRITYNYACYQSCTNYCNLLDNSELQPYGEVPIISSIEDDQNYKSEEILVNYKYSENKIVFSFKNKQLNISEYSFYDINGFLLLNNKIIDKNLTSLTQDIETFTSGTYIMKILTKNGKVYFNKFIITK